MSHIEIECPMCKSTEFSTDTLGIHTCFICNTTWLSGPADPTPEHSE